MQTDIRKSIPGNFSRLACTLVTVTFSSTLYAAPQIILGVPDPFVFTATRTCADRFGNLIFRNCEAHAFPYEAGFFPLPAPVDYRSPFFRPESFHGTPPTAMNTFESAFNEWNNGTGNAWTLVNGGALDITFTIDASDTFASADPPLGHPAGIGNRVGGIVNFSVGTRDYTGLLVDGSPGPAPDQLVWTQAVYMNYSHVGPDQLNHTLDTFTFRGGPNNPDGTADGGPFGNPATPIPGPPNPNNNTAPSVIPANFPATPQRAYADPIYPFQGPVVNGINKFNDAPRGFWDLPASFRGNALLSTVTFTTDAAGAITDRILTVYNGVGYGLNLERSIPEPAFLQLATFLLIIVVLGWYRLRLSESKPGRSPGGAEC